MAEELEHLPEGPRNSVDTLYLLGQIHTDCSWMRKRLTAQNGAIKDLTIAVNSKPCAVQAERIDELERNFVDIKEQIADCVGKRISPPKGFTDTIWCKILLVVLTAIITWSLTAALSAQAVHGLVLLLPKFIS